MSSCVQDGPKPVLPTSIFLASRRAKSITSRDTRSSNKITSADCSARTARNVSNSGSPGPAPTKVTDPLSTAAPKAFHFGNEAVEIRLRRLAVGIERPHAP